MSISGLESKRTESEYLDMSLKMLILKVFKMILKHRKIKNRIKEGLVTLYWTNDPYYSEFVYGYVCLSTQTSVH